MNKGPPAVSHKQVNLVIIFLCLSEFLTSKRLQGHCDELIDIAKNRHASTTEYGCPS